MGPRTRNGAKIHILTLLPTCSLGSLLLLSQHKPLVSGHTGQGLRTARRRGPAAAPREPSPDQGLESYDLWTHLAPHLFLCIKFYWNAAMPVCFCIVHGYVPSAMAGVSSWDRNCKARHV